jgi:hypothetical protein
MMMSTKEKAELFAKDREGEEREAGEGGVKEIAKRMGSRKTAKGKRERPMRAASKRRGRRDYPRVTAKEKGEMTVRAASKRVVKRLSPREVAEKSGESSRSGRRARRMRDDKAHDRGRNCR